MTPALERHVIRAELLHAREVELTAKAEQAKGWGQFRTADRYFARARATREIRRWLLRRIGVR